MKKTIIGIMIMAVAIMMTLSSAVFAANAVTTTVSGDVKVGETVTVTVNHPAGTSAGEYTVTFDADKLTYKGEDTVNGNKIKVAFMDTDYKEVKTHTLTFVAKAEGDAKIEVNGAILADTNGKEMTDVTATGATVKVVADTPVTPDDNNNNNAGNADNNKADNTKKDNTTTTTDNKADNSKKDGDKTITTLKDAKTGFDAMYIVYLAAAVVVAGGIVTVAKRK